MSEQVGAVAMMYETFSHRKTSNDIKVTFVLPAHDLKRFLDTIGEPPNAGESKWVGVARIAGPAE